MASSKSKAKRQAELARKARQRDLRKATVATSSPAAIARAVGAWELKPKPLPDEPVHDVAVFARTSREQLTPDLQAQATAVAEALEWVRQGDDERAVQSLKEIPRTSPFADWRLFVRGLVAFYGGEVPAARDAWSRLDPQRRPARIAATLIKSETDTPLFPEAQGPAHSLVEAARQLRSRAHILAAARAIVASKSPHADVLFSAAQARQLPSFRDDFRSQDPEFVNRFAQACVKLSSFQQECDVFELLITLVPGPPHDPHWNIENFKFQMGFEGAEADVDAAVENYIKHDIPKSTTPEPVKLALASALRVGQARYHLLNERESLGPFSQMFGEQIDSKLIEQLLHKAIKLYPANRNAHRELLDLLEEQAANKRLKLPEKKKIEARLVTAKAELVKAFPDEVATTLWLIDHYFDENQLPEANHLVQQLASYRLEDPRAKALPWKVKIRAAMHSSRRKTQVAQASQELDEAERLWPAWLGKYWLPFLRAAVALRGGNRAKFDELNAQARQASGVSTLAADFMTFAALQHMNVSSAELKPFRNIVEQHIANAQQAPLAHLFEVGDFWWDLTRTGLRNTAYRLQSSQLGKALFQRLKNGEAFKVTRYFEGACCWMAEHGFWRTSEGDMFYSWLTPHLAKHPRITARILNNMNERRYGELQLENEGSQRHLERVKLAAKQDSDPYYRYTMNSLVEDVAEHLAEWRASFGRSPFGGFAGFMDDDDDDDDDECDCDECQAKRARAAAAGKNQGSGFGNAERSQAMFELDDDDDDDDDDDEDDEDWEDEDWDDDSSLKALGPPPAVVIEVITKLAPHGVIDELGELLERLSASLLDPTTCEKACRTVRLWLQKYGINDADAQAFIDANVEMAIRVTESRLEAEHQVAPEPSNQSQTAEERRQSRKQRQKELNKKRGR